MFQRERDHANVETKKRWYLIPSTTLFSQNSKRSQINTSWQAIKSKINEKGEYSTITSNVCTESNQNQMECAFSSTNETSAYDRYMMKYFTILRNFQLSINRFLRFWSVGSSVSTDLRLTNQILYRIILLSIVECFCIQRNHCSEKYSPQNAAYGDHRQEVYVPDTTMGAY